MTGTAGPAVEDADTISHELEERDRRGQRHHRLPPPAPPPPRPHIPFPHNPAPHSDQEGQGHKGSNEQHSSH